MTLSTSAVDVTLPALGRCLRVYSAPEMIEALTRVLPGWPLNHQPAAGACPELYVYRDGEHLWQSAPGTAEEFMLPSPASAACSLVAELLSMRLERDTELLGVHGGSVEINGRLVLFPQSSKAGKSTLAVAFAAAGYRVFGDDVLGLTPQGEGVAMGVAPRLRLPLPLTFSSALADYARRYAGPEDDRYRFILPPDAGLARAGEVCPVGALVLLERNAEPDIAPDVVTLSPGEGLLQLLCQNFAHAASFQQPLPQALMERLLPLMQRVPCLLLRYGEPLAGARHLAQVLARGDVCRDAEPAAEGEWAKKGATITPDEVVASMDIGAPWRPASQVNAYPLGDELFLIHVPSGVIHRLNLTGRLVWLLLQQEPLAVDELGALLAEHFHQPVKAVVADITGLMAALQVAGLVVVDA